MSELNTFISKIAKKYPEKGYDKKGNSIYSAYRDGLINGSVPVFSFTSAGTPETTSRYISEVTGYGAPECLIFMSELYAFTKAGKISNKLLDPKLDIKQSVSKKEFEKMKPGILSVPEINVNMKKIILPIVVPAIIIIGLIVLNNGLKLTKTIKKTI